MIREATTLPAAPRRPRVLSYVGRWGRARRWLPEDAARVVDVGASFGYGTAALAAGRPASSVVGVERDPEHLAMAKRHVPWIPMLEGRAEALPLEDGCADAVVLLDVIEYVADPAAVVAEAHRVLRPGGTFILSAPHRGLLRGLDALNVYPRLRARWFPSWLPVEEADVPAGRRHEHYGVEDLRRLLDGHFAVERVARTGVGLAEPVHLAGLVVGKGLLRSQAAYRVTQPLHLLAYVVDDLARLGRLSYHIMVSARALQR